MNKKRKVKLAERPCQVLRLDAVHLQRVDQPVRVAKRLRLLRNVGIAARIYTSTGARSPNATSPVSTESDVKNLLQSAHACLIRRLK